MRTLVTTVYRLTFLLSAITIILGLSYPFREQAYFTGFFTLTAGILGCWGSSLVLYNPRHTMFSVVCLSVSGVVYIFAVIPIYPALSLLGIFAFPVAVVFASWRDMIKPA